MRVGVIINPVSGLSGGLRPILRRVELANEVLAAEHVAADVAVTERAGQAFELAREMVARGASLVVAWSGERHGERGRPRTGSQRCLPRDRPRRLREWPGP